MIMDEQRVTLWCRVLGKQVETVLVRSPSTQPPIPGVPVGWTVRDCLDKDVECFGKGCPFTTDGGEVPFGEPWERPDPTSEETQP